MALTADQTQQIKSEIEELAALNPFDLNSDQLKGHQERTEELAEIIVEHENKALGVAIKGLISRFKFIGKSLAELESQINHLPDEAPEEEEVADKLKTPLPILELRLREESKTGKVSGKALLKAALTENDIPFDKKDSEKALGQRLKDWLGKEPEVSAPPEPAPEPPKPEPVTLDKAKQLSAELAAYVKRYADQQRAAGADSNRYNAFNRDLQRITRQRLV